MLLEPEAVAVIRPLALTEMLGVTEMESVGVVAEPPGTVIYVTEDAFAPTAAVPAVSPLFVDVP